MKSKLILSVNLKQYREKNRLSQEELAARAELSTRGYGKIERGEVHSSLETLDKLPGLPACRRPGCCPMNRIRSGQLLRLGREKTAKP